MTTFEVKDTAHVAFKIINLRCPHCHHAASFSGFDGCSDLRYNVQAKRHPSGATTNTFDIAGMRRCPNTTCRKLVFVMEDKYGEIESFPPEVIDFDASNLPSDILSSLEEAIRCHAANCYRASALMVRRTLEELCDNKSATGKDLKTRLAALGTVAVIPSELLSAADELRILGNDAAHIEAKDYDSIGKEESEIAIELAKELLKAVYQYTSLVARLTALKKPKQ
ncbi:DUF4145 domain-containing protein [Mesorhizobium japonicum]|uniref:Mll8000 protein n=1 Tax=Mesorhizobium japonicum (strain LMG 29417 / CECT 9101 / MAFF 303099) TaxID=266835 RepID=Q984H8_RHILO|nr:DUF4145 domain-containing protein [Mesorhizobium japonicum]BAB53652.1 mll8000 [Mesorhizobium japonicum MAFF 303099]